MTDLYVWLAAIVLGAATWLAALTLALLQLSRSAAAISKSVDRSSLKCSGCCRRRPVME